MKRGRSSPPHPSSLKKLKYHTFSSSRKDSQFIGYKHKGFSKSVVSMATSGGYRNEKGVIILLWNESQW